MSERMPWTKPRRHKFKVDPMGRVMARSEMDWVAAVLCTMMRVLERHR